MAKGASDRDYPPLFSTMLIAVLVIGAIGSVAGFAWWLRLKGFI